MISIESSIHTTSDALCQCTLYTCQHIPLYFLNYRSMYSSRVFSFFSFISFFGGFFFFVFSVVVCAPCCLIPSAVPPLCYSRDWEKEKNKKKKKKEPNVSGGLSLLMAEPCSTIERTKRSLSSSKTFVLGLFSFAGLSPRYRAAPSSSSSKHAPPALTTDPIDSLLINISWGSPFSYYISSASRSSFLRRHTYKRERGEF